MPGNGPRGSDRGPLEKDPPHGRHLASGPSVWRLRRKQIIERLPGTHRYRLTPHGRAIAVLFTKTYGRVLTPGLTGLSPGLPNDFARRSPLATAWRQLDRALDQHITAGLAAA